jgi:hypothetical protein
MVKNSGPSEPPSAVVLFPWSEANSLGYTQRTLHDPVQTASATPDGFPAESGADFREETPAM